MNTHSLTQTQYMHTLSFLFGPENIVEAFIITASAWITIIAVSIRKARFKYQYDYLKCKKKTINDSVYITLYIIYSMHYTTT